MILGIANGIHNSAAALVGGETVIGAVEEERISRYKRDGRIPTGAVNTILKEYDAENISRIAVSGSVNWSLKRRARSALRGSESLQFDRSEDEQIDSESYVPGPGRSTRLGIGILSTIE